VHITELGGEYFRFDEVRQELRGERTGIRYAIGARVRVQVSRVDLDGRKIDFRIVRDADGERLLARGRKSAADSHPRVSSAAEALAEVETKDRAARRAGRKARAPAGSAKAGKTPKTTRPKAPVKRPKR